MDKKKKRAKKKTTNYDDSHLEKAFRLEWNKTYPNLPAVEQYVFNPSGTKWRFDFFWPKYNVALEIQGYGPGHCSPKGMFNDANKCNTALAMGFITLYLTAKHLEPANIKQTVKYIRYHLSLKE